MNHYLKILLLTSLSFLFIVVCKGQSAGSTSEVLRGIGTNWKKDSLSCNGYRLSVAEQILKSKVDSIGKIYLISTIGQPNKVQKFYSGVTNKNYVGYIYYIYKDNCPKIDVESAAIQFVFDESEKYLIEVNQIEYCY